MPQCRGRGLYSAKCMLRPQFRVVKSGRAFRLGPGSGLSLSKYFGLISGLHTKFIRNEGHFCRQLLLKQSRWLNLQEKMIICVLFIHVYFATPPIPVVAHILTHSEIWLSGLNCALKTNVWIRSSKWGPFQTLQQFLPRNCVVTKTFVPMCFQTNIGMALTLLLSEDGATKNMARCHVNWPQTFCREKPARS